MPGGAIAFLVGLVVAGGAAYFAAGLGPNADAVAAVEADTVAAVEADPIVSVDRTAVGTAARDGPATASTVGLVYYPGGRVVHESYVPTAAEIVAASDRAALVVVVDAPLNLAVLAPDRADRVRERYPEVDAWAVGGHSLGGAMACRHAAGRAEAYDALVLHAAYCDRDVSETGFDVLSVLGGADGVIDTQRERASRSNLPTDAWIVELDGVNHVGFGAYGPQPGDNPASLSAAASRQAVGNATGTGRGEPRSPIANGLAPWLASVRTEARGCQHRRARRCRENGVVEILNK